MFFNQTDSFSWMFHMMFFPEAGSWTRWFRTPWSRLWRLKASNGHWASAKANFGTESKHQMSEYCFNIDSNMKHHETWIQKSWVVPVKKNPGDTEKPRPKAFQRFANLRRWETAIRWSVAVVGSDWSQIWNMLKLKAILSNFDLCVCFGWLSSLGFWTLNIFSDFGDHGSCWCLVMFFLIKGSARPRDRKSW